MRRILKAFLYSNLIAIPLTVATFAGVNKVVEKYEVEFEEFTFDTKPTSIKDRNGSSLANFYPDRRSVTMYREIPKEITDAFIASEDRDFFKHAGFSIRGITRAAVEIFKANGNIVQGGSTITQQFVKMSMLSSEKSYERKIKEILYATQLEEESSKEEIFELYLNQIEFKYHAFGIKDALMTYFGLDFQTYNELPRIERIKIASLLTAMVQNPTVYDPFQKAELTKTKRDAVIDDLYATNKITQGEMVEAKNSSLGVLESPKRVFEDEKIINQELVHFALNEASEKLNMTVEEIKTSGYDIQTSFDLEAYQVIRDAMEDDSKFAKNIGSGKARVQAAAVFVTPLNGEIIAFSGGRDEIQNFMDFNRAFQMKKQPASTFKPIISYGPALESGKFTASSYLLDDAGHVFPGGYAPKNWDGKGRGKVTMKEAMRQSWNIPAVWTLQQVGVQNAKDYAAKLGIDLSEEPNYLTMALGGLEKGVSPLQMADAYQAFATGGYRTEAHSIRIVADKKGKVIYKTVINTENVVDVNNAKSLKSMLINAVQNGTGKGAKYASTVGGKSGTNGHGIRKGANGDYWFVGFDDEVIVGSVWMGFDKVTNQDYLGGSSSIAANLFKAMAKPISKIAKAYDLENNFELVENDKGEEFVIKPAIDIKLNGSAVIELEYGEEYIEKGAVAKDDNFGDLTNQIKITGSVDIFSPGEYILKYQLLEGYDVLSETTRKIIVNKKKSTTNDYDKTLEYSKEGNNVTLFWNTFEDTDVLYKVFANDKLVTSTRKNTYSGVINDNEVAVYQVVIVRNGETILTTPTVRIDNSIVEEIKVPVEEKPETEVKPETESTKPETTDDAPTLPNDSNVTPPVEVPQTGQQNVSGVNNTPVSAGSENISE